METVSRPSWESRAFDSDQSASHSASASYLRARAGRADLVPDDPVPLFLSDPLGEPDPREYAPLALQSRARSLPYIFAAILAICAAGILGILFQSELRSIVAFGATPARVEAATSPPATRQVPLKDPARVTNAVLASADSRELPAPALPTREAIATAYQVALQAKVQDKAQDQVHASSVTPPASPPSAKTLDPETLAGLMGRAKNLLAVGDINAARLLLERAANAQDATAAFLLAQTHDPAVLGTNDSRTVSADAAAARDWYRKAAALGSNEARQRLAQLQN